MKKDNDVVNRIELPLFIAAVALILLFFLAGTDVFLGWFLSTFLTFIASVFLLTPVIQYIARHKQRFEPDEGIFLILGIFSWAMYILISKQSFINIAIVFLQQLFVTAFFLTFILLLVKLRKDGK